MSRNENFLIALTLLLIDGYWLKITLELPQSASTTIYGPSFFPMVIIAGIFICSMMFLWSGFRQKPVKTKDDDITKCQESNRNKVIAFIVLVVGYVFLFQQIGFFLASVLYIVIGQYIFGIRNKLVMFVVSPAVILALNILFVQAFKIPIP